MILWSRLMLSWMVKQYLQHVKYNLFVVFVLHKNSKRTLAGSKYLFTKRLLMEVVKYSLCKSFLCYFPLSDSEVLFVSARGLNAVCALLHWNHGSSQLHTCHSHKLISVSIQRHVGAITKVYFWVHHASEHFDENSLCFCRCGILQNKYKLEKCAVILTHAAPYPGPSPSQPEAYG